MFKRRISLVVLSLVVLLLMLGVSQKTVRNTLSGVLSKLGLKDRIELCYYYLGLLDITRHIHPGQFPAETPKLPG